MLARQLLEVRDNCAVPSEREIRLDPFLERLELKLGQALALGPREVHVGHLG